MILNSLKKQLGIESSYTHFDQDILFSTNAIISSLMNIGFKPSITNVSELTTWDELLSNDPEVQFIQYLIFLKVRLSFDPPTNSFLVDLLKNQISEMEWRVSVIYDKK